MINKIDIDKQRCIYNYLFLNMIYEYNLIRYEVNNLY